MQLIPRATIILLLILPATTTAGEKASSKASKPAARATTHPFPDTTLQFTLNRGTREETWCYRARERTIRLDRVGKIIPSPPIYLLDLKKGRTETWRPHNGTWSQEPLEKPKAIAGFPGRSPGPPPGVALPRVSRPALAGVSRPTRSVRPPIDLPAAKVPSPGAAGVRVGFPPPGDHWGGNRTATATLKLAAVENTKPKTILGIECTRHVIELAGRGNWTLWLTDRKDLPPLHLPSLRIDTEPGGPDTHRVLELLRNEQRFPMRATFEGIRGNQVFELRVDALHHDKIPSQRFQRPDNFHEVPSFR